ncbi:MAG: Cna B-type domain-containing protein, partial [Solobacterium sp.]|nr:Cna B-type domain-containing protein [Solobacterium sp.]
MQFDNESVLTYNFPPGLLVSDLGAATFPIEVTSNGETITVSDNTFEVSDGQLRVRFNQNDPNFDRLTAASNTRFSVAISSYFDQEVGEIAFNPSIVKDFVYEVSGDLTITKNVVYDKDTDTAFYTLQVTSSGTNENVVIEDHLTGTALVFNRDVSAESSLTGTITAVPDYNAIENGFRLEIPQMNNNETLTLHYTATVDNTKISGNGTIEQTINTAMTSSDQLPDGKEVSADFAGQADFERIRKFTAGEPVDLGNGTYEQTWLIRVNKDHKMEMGDTDISDWIVSASRPFMLFAGDGITVEMTSENGQSETRAVSWEDLFLYSNNNGIYGWAYHTPSSDGNAAYEITCTTLIHTEGALNTLTLSNGAQVYGSYDEATATIGVIGDDVFNIDKDVLSFSSEESEWQITLTVPGSGLPDLRVTDDMPRLQYEGQTYIDYLIEDSLEIEGLQEEESWRISFDNDNRTFNIFFYKTDEQTSANAGITSTPNGEPRDIVIRYKTAVNQDWLSLAAENGYASNTLRRHRNTATARTNDYRLPPVYADAYPVKPVFEKSFTERSEVVIDGVTYPVFRYALAVSGLTQNGIVIHDVFPTEYLKYYAIEGVQLTGGMMPASGDTQGSASVTETADGIDITITSLPQIGGMYFYPYYRIEYALIVKDAVALQQLNTAASATQFGTDIENTASWEDYSSSQTIQYTYFPYVDKELLTRPTQDNGYVAEFKVLINQYAEDLDPASDILTIRDILSSNLRFLPDSLVISPGNDNILVQHDAETNALILDNVPDGTAFEITYQARVLGSGNVTYSNTIQFGNYEKTITEEASITSSGGGSASNPGITIVKRDAENISDLLVGASFQLFYLDENSTQIPVRDRNGQDVTITTSADGTALLVGNQQAYGWTLWEGRTYCLVETAPPAGYEINEQPTYFILSEFPASQMEYDLTGDLLYISDSPEKTSVQVTKQWIGPETDEITVHLTANGEDTGKSLTLQASDNWTGSFDDLRRFDKDGEEIFYRVEEERLAHYDPEYSGTAETGFIITNKNTETVRLPVRKQWIGPSCDSVTVKLMRQYEAEGTVITEDTGLVLELNAQNQWSTVFENLPKYVPDGTEYKYLIDEVTADGYLASIEYDENGDCVITNTNTEMISIPVTKQWTGTPLTSVALQLYADGVLIDERKLTANDSWHCSFTELPKYDSTDGHEIVYDVQEVPMNGYVSERDGSVNTGFTFTNTITGKVSIPVIKRWIGPPAENVTIELLADKEKVDEAVLNVENGWQHTFADLEKYG